MRALFCGLLGLLPVICQAAVPWNLDALQSPPQSEAKTNLDDGVKSIFYDGLPWKGKPTKVFAYYGIPKSADGKPVPAMVLVHGGGGSAFIPWVKLWMDRGYAAIAMDTCGAVSGGGHNNHPRHPDGGPPGWGGFAEIDEPLEDQWTYHAVADVILAHSWLRAQPGVDAERTGITGISWGGYLTCIVAGLDGRFKFAAPVYGCGFLGEDSTWLGDFQKMGPEKSAKWLANWDPAVYLPKAAMPMLWVDGTNDFAYPLDSLQKSYQLPTGGRFLAIRPRMLHGHGGPGENPKEIQVMADAILKGGVPLPTVKLAARDGAKVSATFQSQEKVVSAVLNYTLDGGAWLKREWKEIPAVLADGTISATLPEGTKVYYFSLTDARDVIASTGHEEL